MKITDFAFFVIILYLAIFVFACSNVAGGLKGNNFQGSEIVLPWKPEEFGTLFEKCELIVFSEVIKVFNRIEGGKNDSLEHIRWYDKQTCEVKIFRVLKGSKKLNGKIIQVTKGKSNYYLSVLQKRVFYLKRENEEYVTLDTFSGEHRLASVVSNIKNFENKGRMESGGIVLSIRSKSNHLPIEVYVFHGRLKAPLEKGEATRKRHIFKILKTDELGICEIGLEKGHYTFLVELGGRLYSHSRLVEGYYPYCIVANKWRPIYFNI